MPANKLSTLMREGAKLHPQTRWDLVSEVDGQICTCAVGAVYEAAFQRLPAKSLTFTQALEDLEKALPNGKELAAIRIKSPVQHHLKWSIYGVVMELNDMHGWTREEIADFLEREGY